MGVRRVVHYHSPRALYFFSSYSGCRRAVETLGHLPGTRDAGNYRCQREISLCHPLFSLPLPLHSGSKIWLFVAIVYSLHWINIYACIFIHSPRNTDSRDNATEMSTEATCAYNKCPKRFLYFLYPPLHNAWSDSTLRKCVHDVLHFQDYLCCCKTVTDACVTVLFIPLTSEDELLSLNPLRKFVGFQKIDIWRGHT